VAAFFRFSLASSIFLPSILKVYKDKPKVVLNGFYVGVFNSAGYFSQAMALVTSNAANAAFICSMSVVVVPILDLILLPKTATKNNYLQLLPPLLALCGIACLELGGTAGVNSGDLVAVFMPLFFGYAYFKNAALVKDCNGPDEALAFTGSAVLAVAVMSLFWLLGGFVLPSFLEGGIQSVLLNTNVQFEHLTHWPVYLAIAWTGIFTTALTSFGENLAMKTLTAAETTIIFSTEPLWGTAFAWLLLKETIGVNTLAGAACILTACLWSQFLSEKKVTD